MVMQDTDAGTYSSRTAENDPPSEDGSTGGRLKGVMDQARQKARETGAQFTEEARERGRSTFSDGKHRAAEELGKVAEAFRATGERLREQNQPSVAKCTDSFAGQVERFSGYLREKDVDDIVCEVEDFARRRPAVYLGGALALGFLMARFFKSSDSQSDGGTEYYSEYDEAPMIEESAAGETSL